MILKSIDLYNFMCYYGENRLEFNEGINVIIGDNGYGKSKLFDGFYWVMYDKCFDTSSKEFRPTKEINNTIISDRAIHEAEDGQIECSVTLTFFDSRKEDTYTIQRQLKGTKDDGNVNFGTKSVEKVTKKTAFLEAQVVDDENEIERIKRKILPDNIKPYMWFQGEQVENIIDFRNSETLTQAINVLSDISRFDNITSTAETLLKQAKKELKKKQRSLSNDKEKSDELAAEQERLEKKLTSYKLQLKEATENSRKAESKSEELLNKLEDAKTIKELSDKRKEIERDYNRVHQRLRSEQLSFHKKLFTNSWILKGTKDLYDQFSDKYSMYEKERLSKQSEIQAKMIAQKEIIEEMQTRLPLNVPEPVYVQQMLEQEHCLVCDRPAEKGSEPYKSIESLINRSKEKVKNLEEEEISKHDFSSSFKSLYQNGLIQENKIPGIDDDIANTLTLIQKLNDEKDELKDQLDEIEGEIQNYIIETSINIDQANNIIHSLRAQQDYAKRFNTEIGYYNNEIEETKRKLNQKEKQFENLVVGNIPDSLHKKVELCEDLYNATKSTRDRVFQELIQTLEDEANKHYLSMTQDNLSARGIIRLKEYNGNYTPELVDDNGEVLFQLNTGNIILIKLATIMAIISARKNTRETDLYTLISDAPMSVFGDDYTIGFCKTVSQIYRQSIIMSKEFYKNESLRNELLKSDEVNLGKVYMVTPNLPESERSNRAKLATNIKALN
ncbi:MAG: AAA family ATPase [Gracilimonas sp.]